MIATIGLVGLMLGGVPHVKLTQVLLEDHGGGTGFIMDVRSVE